MTCLIVIGGAYELNTATHLLLENLSDRRGKKLICRREGELLRIKSITLSRKKMAEEPQKASSSSLHQPSSDKKPEDAEIKPQVCDF